MAILAQRTPVFQQAMRIISNITNSYPAQVTTTFAHQYITGMIVRINIPAGQGMQQINKMYAPIVVTSSDSFNIDIDSTYFDPFISLISVGTTDSSGNLTGTITSNIVPFRLGQSFTIGSEYFQVITPSGALFAKNGGAGTFDISTGDFTFLGANTLTQVYFNQIPYPESAQYSQVTPVGEVSSILASATRNVLPYSAS